MFYPPDYRCGHLCGAHLSKQISASELNRCLRGEGYGLCKNSWFKRKHWSLDEAVMIFYDFDPSYFEAVPWEDKQRFFKAVDSELDIYGILQSHIPGCHFPDPTTLCPIKVGNLLTSLEVELPTAFEKRLGLSVSCDARKGNEESKISSFPLLSKGAKRTTHRKAIIAHAAEAYRLSCEEQGKPIPKAAEIKRDKHFDELVSLVNEISGLKDHSDGIDLEWINAISHLKQSSS